MILVKDVCDAYKADEATLRAGIEKLTDGQLESLEVNTAGRVRAIEAGVLRQVSTYTVGNRRMTEQAVPVAQLKLIVKLCRDEQTRRCGC